MSTTEQETQRPPSSSLSEAQDELDCGEYVKAEASLKDVYCHMTCCSCFPRPGKGHSRPMNTAAKNGRGDAAAKDSYVSGTAARS